jgi:hypothetical protein
LEYTASTAHTTPHHIRDASALSVFSDFSSLQEVVDWYTSRGWTKT